MNNASWKSVEVGQRLRHSDLSGFLGLEVLAPTAVAVKAPQVGALAL